MGFSSGAAFLFYQDADNVEHFLHKGPDIVARNPATGKTVIVEVKGTNVTGTTNFTNSRFKGELQTPAGTIHPYQLSREWLVTDPDRYLAPLEAAALANPSNIALNEAAQRLDTVAYGGGDYEAILMGFSTTKAEFGRLDDLLERLTEDALNVRTYLINP